MSTAFRVDVREIRENLPAFLRNVAEKQVRFATMLALDDIARESKDKVRAEMPKVFNAPTPYALNSLRIVQAKKDRLFSELAIKDVFDKGTAPLNFLGPHIGGTGRKLKGSEVMLREKGILPPGYYTRPGKHAKLDKYGNQKRSEITEVLSGLKAFRETGYNANRTLNSYRRNKRLREFFVIKSAGFSGVMERRGKELRHILLFLRREPKYKPEFKFAQIATTNWQGRFMDFFIPRLKKAVENSGTKGKWTR